MVAAATEQDAAYRAATVLVVPRTDLWRVRQQLERVRQLVREQQRRSRPVLATTYRLLGSGRPPYGQSEARPSPVSAAGAKPSDHVRTCHPVPRA